MRGSVHISHADKELWPATQTAPAITKADLAAYYETVAGWMLPHIRGRPCSVVRAPDGIRGERFYQRHPMRGASDRILQVKVRGAARPYLQFDNVAALAAAAQIAAVELHPWNCRPGDPDTPGRLVFDLDPAPGVAFDEVIAAAREVRERLLLLGLESFCKTTGGKGLHVVAPFKTSNSENLTWPLAKAFALAICKSMAADAPERFVVALPKRRRSGKVFLDYLRNDRTATAVAPLSPRARPGAPVAMPLTWAQLRTGLDPRRFTLRTAPALIARSQAWADYGDAQRPLVSVAKRFLSAQSR